MTKPLANVGEFAVLKVVATEKIGAFLRLGTTKDLFLPFSEQTRTVKVGDYLVVFLYLDKAQRLTATMRLEKNIDRLKPPYKTDEMVDLLIIGKTELGFKAIINGKHLGIIYSNQVFQALSYGQYVKGYVHKIRDDSKIDLRLQALGSKGSDDIAQKILDLLAKEDGFLPLTSDTPSEKISEYFGVSKKKYKMALGGLYKKRLIVIEEGGVRLKSSIKF